MPDVAEDRLTTLERHAGRLKELCRLSLSVQDQSHEVLGTIVREAARILEAPICMISLLQHGEMVFKQSHNAPPALERLGRVASKDIFCGTVAESGTALVVNDVGDSDPKPGLELARQLNIGSYLGVPLKCPTGSLSGTLCLMSNTPSGFTDEDIEFLGVLAERAGTEIERESYVHELMDLKERFEQLSTIDELTRMFNRRYIRERLEKEFSRAKRYGCEFTLIMLDIDHFKVINDEHGHVFGDLILKEVALVVKSSIRDVDVISRYGGEEFAIILPQTPEDKAMIAAERIRKNIDEHVFADERHAIRLTICIGISSYPAPSVSTAQHLIDRADEALYKAKRQGPNNLAKASAS